jgi:hypothetical protein
MEWVRCAAAACSQTVQVNSPSIPAGWWYVQVAGQKWLFCSWTCVRKSESAIKAHCQISDKCEYLRGSVTCRAWDIKAMTTPRQWIRLETGRVRGHQWSACSWRCMNYVDSSIAKHGKLRTDVFDLIDDDSEDDDSAWPSFQNYRERRYGNEIVADDYHGGAWTDRDDH